MTEPEPIGREFYFVGGLLCLDLVNTEAVHRGEPVDLLDSFPDLVAWLRGAGALTHEAARAAWERWGGSRQADAALREAKALRAALRELAERMAAGKAPGQAALDRINAVLATRPAYAEVVQDGKGYATRVRPVGDSAVHLLVPVAESAAWLLVNGERSRVGRCESDRCVLVFYDTTKNKTRRWCNMQACGSRAKSAAYYRRRRSAP